MSLVRIGALLAVCVAASALAEGSNANDLDRPRNVSLEIGLGGYKPDIDSASGLTGTPYQDTFGNGSMLLFQAEVDRFLWQKYGSVAVGFAFGYGEKYGPALVGSTGATSTEKTAIRVVPLRIQAVYRLDYGALHWGIPLVPFAKLGLAYTPWWITKGGSVEYFNGQRGAGAKWGYSVTGGLALMLDFLEPDLARNLANDTGIEHTYLMAQYIHDKVPGFGGNGLNLSSDHWLFSLAMDF